MTDDTRPQPLVQADVDLNGLPYMPLEVVRVMQSTLFGLSSGDEFKAAFALWCASWYELPAASLPKSDQMLEFLSRSKVWKRVKERALHGWIECSDGRLYHRTLARVAIDAWDRREDWRETQHNKNERQERWRQRCKELGDALRSLGVTPPKGAGLEKLETMLKDAQETHNPSTPRRDVDGGVDAGVDGGEIALKGSEAKRREVKRREGTKGRKALASQPTLLDPPDPRDDPAADAAQSRGTRLPAGWTLPRPWGLWTLENLAGWSDDRVRLEAAKFADFWAAKSGKDATKVDWLATWRNWCRNAKPPAGAPHTPAPEDRAARHAAVRAAMGIPDGGQETIDA